MAASDPSEQVRPLRVLVDINVVLDQLLRREPWFTEAQAFWQARDARRVLTYLPASVVTDVFYISRKQIGNDQARHAVMRCMREFGLLAVYRAVLEDALALAGSDFEDDVQIACARLAKLDLIVTRNTADFRFSPVPAIKPSEIAQYLV